MKYFIASIIIVSDRGAQLPDIEQVVIQTSFDTLKKSTIEKELTDLLRKNHPERFTGAKVVQVGIYDASNDPAAVQSIHALSQTYKFKEVVPIQLAASEGGTESK